MSDQPGCNCSICEENHMDNTTPLIERLILAALDTLKDGDPVITIAIGNNQLNIGWTPK